MNEIMTKVSKDPSYKDFEFALKSGNIKSLRYINNSLLRRIMTLKKFKEYDDPSEIETLYLFQMIVSSLTTVLEDFEFSK